MENVSILLIIGSAMVFAFSAGKAVDRFRLPMVIGYVFIGVLLGGSFLNVLDAETVKKVSLINDLALGVIAFMIGGELNFSRLKTLGKSILIIAIFESLGAFFLVGILTYLFTGKIYLALILGAISSATAPAATVAVINQYRAKGPLTTTILGVVGSDDAIALIIYAFASAIASSFLGQNSLSLFKVVLAPLKEVFFSSLIGAFLGLVLSYFLNRIRSKEECFALVIGVLLVAEGIAIQFHLSELLLVMAMAIVGSNFASHKIDSALKYLHVAGFPIIAAFFCLAGTKLDITLLPKMGLLGLIYLVSRITGKFFGAKIGAKVSNAPLVVKKYIGLSLWPQIGVAIALAIIVGEDFAHLGQRGQELADLVINILLFTTIITEVIGPLATKFSLTRAGEIDKCKLGS